MKAEALLIIAFICSIEANKNFLGRISYQNSSKWTPPSSKEYEAIIQDCKGKLDVNDKLYNLSNYGVILDELVESGFPRCVDEKSGVLENNVYYVDRLIERESLVKFRPQISNKSFTDCLDGASNLNSDDEFIKYFWACTITPLYYTPDPWVNLTECTGPADDVCIHINGYMRLDYMKYVLCSFQKMGYYFQLNNTNTWTFSNFRIVQNTAPYSVLPDYESYEQYSKCFVEGIPVDEKTLLDFEKCQNEQNGNKMALNYWDPSNSTEIAEYKKECQNNADYYTCMANKTLIIDYDCFYVERSIKQMEIISGKTDIRDPMRLCFESSFVSGTIHLDVFYQCAETLFD